MDYDAIVAQVLAPHQQETGGQCEAGALLKWPVQEFPAEHTSIMLDIYS
jgi:hypothetical protein